MTGVRKGMKLIEAMLGMPVHRCLYRQQIVAKWVLSTFPLPNKGLKRSVVQLRINRRWVRLRDAIIGVMRICGVPIYRRCHLANRIMFFAFGEVPPVEANSKPSGE